MGLIRLQRVRTHAAADWTSANPYLQPFELGIESESPYKSKLNVFDIPKRWNDLDYWSPGGATGGGGGAAEDVTFTPAGGIEATDVQAAIEELDTEKLDSDVGDLEVLESFINYLGQSVNPFTTDNYVIVWQDGIQDAVAVIDLGYSLGGPAEAGDTITIDGVTWTFVAGTPGDHEIDVGSDTATQTTNIYETLEADLGEDWGVWSDTGVVTVYPIGLGAAGNDKTISAVSANLVIVPFQAGRDVGLYRVRADAFVPA